MTNYAQHFNKFNPKATQTEKMEPGQVENNAGGFVYELDKWGYLDRFLVLGCEGNTYYASEQKLTRDAATNVEACITENGVKVVERIVEISQAGRAPKNDPALFALAMCLGLGNAETKKAAGHALSAVARIGTHIMHFAEYLQAFSKWNRTVRAVMSSWYTDKSADDLAFQAVKYQQRDGWSHRDILRLAHPSTEDKVLAKVFDWIAHNKREDFKLPRGIPGIIKALEKAKDATEDELRLLIRENKLPMEAIPTDKRTPLVYTEILATAGITWILRNLGNLGKHGILAEGRFEPIQFIESKLLNEELLRKAKVHPIQILSALRTYTSGKGVRGKGAWPVVPDVEHILDKAFRLAFKNVEPTGKRICIGLDVSGSMDSGEIAGVPGLTPRDASVAMCLVTAAVEAQVAIGAFSGKFIDSGISKHDTLQAAIIKARRIPYGDTDCAQPMLHALMANQKFDAFVLYTDNETWSGAVHPMKALRSYRQEMSIPAKLIVVGLTATQFSIADPKDAGAMDCVGMDAATPQLIADFIRG